MIKAKTLTNVIVFILVAVAAFSLYVSTRPKVMVSAPTFIYEEIVVHKAAAQIKASAVPVPARPSAAALPIIPPKVISTVLPEYPTPALKAGTEGLVMVQAYIGSKGTAERVEIKTSSGDPELDQAAIKAVSQWRFAPAAQGGTALNSWFEVPVRFSIK
jgi:protein TonB